MTGLTSLPPPAPFPFVNLLSKSALSKGIAGGTLIPAFAGVLDGGRCRGLSTQRDSSRHGIGASA